MAYHYSLHHVHLVSLVKCDAPFFTINILYLNIDVNRAKSLSIQKTNDARHFILGGILNESLLFDRSQNEATRLHSNDTQLTLSERKELSSPHTTEVVGGLRGLGCALVLYFVDDPQ